MPDPKLSHHVRIMGVLSMMDRGFLMEAGCFFAGGTRIAIELGEYRLSDDIDFMVSGIEGWRRIRSTVQQQSLGALFRKEPLLAREVRADRYGIRTFVMVDDCPIKLEVIREDRHRLRGCDSPDWPVPVADRASMMCQKLFAVADRGLDRRFMNRDIIDLAYMLASWGKGPLHAGMNMAEAAYGTSIRRGVRDALVMASSDVPDWERRLDDLGVNPVDGRLSLGLRLLNRIVERPVPREDILALAQAGPTPVPPS